MAEQFIFQVLSDSFYGLCRGVGCEGGKENGLEMSHRVLVLRFLAVTFELFIWVYYAPAVRCGVNLYKLIEYYKALYFRNLYIPQTFV